MNINRIRELEGQMVEQPKAETYEREVPDGSLIKLMLDYQNKKEHFFRVSQAFKPNPSDVDIALNLYMESSTRYYNAKNGIKEINGSGI